MKSCWIHEAPVRKKKNYWLTQDTAKKKERQKSR